MPRARRASRCGGAWSDRPSSTPPSCTHQPRSDRGSTFRSCSSSRRRKKTRNSVSLVDALDIMARKWPDGFHAIDVAELINVYRSIKMLLLCANFFTRLHDRLCRRGAVCWQTPDGPRRRAGQEWRGDAHPAQDGRNNRQENKGSFEISHPHGSSSEIRTQSHTSQRRLIEFGPTMDLWEFGSLREFVLALAGSGFHIFRPTSAKSDFPELPRAKQTPKTPKTPMRPVFSSIFLQYPTIPIYLSIAICLSRMRF